MPWILMFILKITLKLCKDENKKNNINFIYQEDIKNIGTAIKDINKRLNSF